MLPKPKALLAAAALAGSMAALPGAASAALMTNWYFCTAGGCNGSNYTSGDKIKQYLDLVGSSYVQTDVPTSSGNFNFKEWGAFRIDYHDGGAPLTNPNWITATFTGQGTGTLGGTLSFQPYALSNPLGVINVYSDTANNFATATATAMYGADDGTPIAQFLLVSGSGLIDTSGIPNGAITLVAAASMVAPGYFFTSSGVDMSTLVGGGTPILFGFTTVNASRVEDPLPAVVSEIVNEFAGDPSFANTLPVAGQQAGEMVFGNNGQFRLVPEPASLALLGLGFSAMGFVARRRNKA